MHLYCIQQLHIRTFAKQYILQIAGTLQGRICSLDGPPSPHRGTSGIPGVWSITGLTGRLQGSYKLIMHVRLYTMRSYTRPYTIHASVP